jgi:hypothetical protein
MNGSIDFNDPKYHAPTPKAATTAEASDMADLQAKYDKRQRDALELARLQATPLPQAPKSAMQQAVEARAVSRGTVLGKNAAEAENKLPSMRAISQRALNEGAALLKHPGFEAAVGMPLPYLGGFGIGTLPYTPARDFNNALDSVKRGAFMQAYEQLRGSGSISGPEGVAATEALANMNTSTSEVQFKRELQRFMNIVASGMKVAEKQSRMGISPFSYDQLSAEKQRRAAATGVKK